MEQMHVTKETFTVELGQKIVFFKLAEGGAMGKPGVVEFFTDDCQSYDFHMGLDGIGTDLISFVFPPIEEVLYERRLGPWGLDVEFPVGWHYIDLGAGNHLVAADSVYGRFKELTKHCKRPSEIYRIWYETAERVTYEIFRK